MGTVEGEKMPQKERKLGIWGKFVSLWVALCIGADIGLGRLFPQLSDMPASALLSLLTSAGDTSASCLTSAATAPWPWLPNESCRSARIMGSIMLL